MKSLILIFGLIFLSSVNCGGVKGFSHNPPQFRAEALEDKAVITQAENEAGSHHHDPKVEPGPDYRLPGNLIPAFYMLRIRPIIDGDYPGIGERNTAPGEVVILIECVESTRRIVLHSKFLQINESSIQVLRNGNPETPIDILNVETDEERDFLIINVASEITNGTIFDLHINFIANVPPNDSLRGLYSEEYWDPLTNRTKVMAVTQMEPLRARQVFPCFDEPTYKSIFNVGITRTENFTSESNQKYLSTQPDREHPGWFSDYFQPTVPMPTYLLALAVHDYWPAQAERSLYHLEVRVWGPHHLVREGKAQLTADATAMLMDNFEKRYQIPHHMLKVDSISVPHKRGAMENYGLITYGEYYLMYHNDTTTSTELRGIYSILAHELAHQWFGNLVTCKWWSDIWLNEGFATYMSYIGQHDLWPEYNGLTHMLSSINNALQYDAGPNSHPVHNDAYNAEQIGTNMDTIGYDKGAAMVRLMASFIPEYAFNEGLINYLNNQYDGVAEQDDLFRALNASAREWNVELPKNVSDIMGTWTLQKGFPLVRINRTSGDDLVISQEPWENADVRNDTSSPGTTWDIPIKYMAVYNDQGQGRIVDGSVWLLSEQRSTTLTIPNFLGWVLLNEDAGGFHRTLYDDFLTNMLLEQLRALHRAFSDAGRVRLIDDQLNLGFQQYIPIQKALDFTMYLGQETDPTVWHAVLNNLGKVKNFYRNLANGTEDLEALDASLGGRILSVLRTIPVDTHETPSAEAILRSQLIDWTCTLSMSNVSMCHNHTLEMLAEWKETGNNPVHTDLQSTIYCKMMESGGAVGGFDWLLDQYWTTTNTFQRSRLSSALGCSTNATEISSILDLIFLTGGVRQIEKEHTIPLFQKLITHSHEGMTGVVQLFLESPEQIPDYYDGDLSSVMQILNAVAPHYSDEMHLDIIKSIVEANPDFYKDSLNATISTIEKNIEWLEVFRQNMTSWFQANAVLSL